MLSRQIIARIVNFKFFLIVLATDVIYLSELIQLCRLFFSRTLIKLYLYKVIKKRKLPQFLFINNNSISTIFHNLFARC